jgi:hypothetical protein
VTSPRRTDLRSRLRARSYGELLETALFWLDVKGAPPPAEAIVDPLAEAMLDADRVASRLRSIGEKPKAVLAATLRTPGASFASTQHAATGLKGYEFDSAAAELVKLGFLFAERRGGAVVYRAADDAVAALAEALSQDGRSLDTVFSRAAFAASRGADPAREGPLAPRVEAAAARAGDVVRDLVLRFGGLVTRATFEKLDSGGGPERDGAEWDRTRLREALESAGVGTAARLSLEEYGIALRDEALVAFHETLAEAIAEAEPLDPAGLEIASAGVDGLADLFAIVSRVRASGARLTLASRLYKTSRRVLGAEMVSKEGAGPAEEMLDFLVQFARHARLVEEGPDQRLAPAAGAAAFEALPLREKLRRVVAFSLGERSEPALDFHLRRMRKTLVACAARLRPGDFVPAGVLPALARNRYFAEMDRLEVREQYQTLYQHLKAPPTADPLALVYGALRFVTRRLHPLGIFDLGLRAGRVEALRLTELGAEVLSGAEPRRGEGAAPVPGALIVNPDFEVVVFPDGATPEVLYALSRFSTRVKSDTVATYRLTRESVARAAAGGLSADEIVLALEEHARAAVPQNVAVTIRDWARAARLHVGSATPLLEASDAESLESLLRIDGLAALVVRRVSDTTVELSAVPREEGLLRELARRGVRVDGACDP